MTKFKLLHPNDLNAVLAILRSHNDSMRFGLNWSLDQIKKSLTTDQGFGFFESEMLIAFILGRKIDDKIFEIDLMMTDFQHIKKGFMNKLFQESLKYLKNNSHLEEIWLEVHEENMAAVHFYKKVGFLENTKRPKYYPDGKGAILMSLRRV
jgi:ribosomal protein S18 acetylase RimI-like enzyme